MYTPISSELSPTHSPFALSSSKGGLPPASRRGWRAALRQAQGERSWLALPFLLLLLLLLTACDGKIPDKAGAAKAEANAQAIAEAEGKIECAGKGETAFAYACGLDRTQSQDGLYLTLRHPDGAFRRLLVTTDGRGVIAADGAETATVTVLAPDLIEVEVGGARYRLPATVRQPAAKAP